MTIQLSKAELAKHYADVKARLYSSPVKSKKEDIERLYQPVRKNLNIHDVRIVKAPKSCPKPVIRDYLIVNDAARLELEPRITCADVMNMVAYLTEYSVDRLRSDSRTARLFRWRAAAMYVLYNSRQDLTYPIIGRAFNRDHSSVIHAISRVRENWPEFEIIVSKICKGLGIGIQSP